MRHIFLIYEMAAILDAIWKFSKCSMTMMPVGYHSDSSITTYSLT